MSTTKILAWSLPLFLLGCGDGPKSTGSDAETGATNTATGDATGSPTTGPGTATGTAGDPSGDPTGITTGDPSGDPGGPTTTTMTSASDTGTGCAGAPVFETDIIPILNASGGAGDNACHSRAAYAADAKADCRGWLALEDEPLGSVYYAGPTEGQPTGCPDIELFMRLTTLDAWQCEQFDPRVRYVVPCKPEESYLIHKVDGGPLCSLSEGVPSQPMPLGKPLPPDELATLRAWIAAGAPRVGDACPIDCDGDIDPGPQDPVAQINHPGDGEVRKVDVDIPFVGLATDPQDGMVPADKLMWTSDLEGPIGVGENFSAPLTMVGKHTITLTATDIDGNEGTASLVLTME
jgi:hypothetical protein